MGFRFVVALIVFLIAAACSGVAWYLTRPLPNISPPRVRIDDRTQSYPSTEELSYQDEQKGELLTRFREAFLEAGHLDERQEIYRLILLPTFDPPAMVRVENVNGKRRLIVKKLSGLGGYGIDKLGTLASASEVELNGDQWAEIQRRIDYSSFWYIPALDATDELVHDGAYWYLEGSTGVYHSVGRIQPKNELMQVHVYLLELAGLKSQYAGYIPEASLTPN